MMDFNKQALPYVMLPQQGTSLANVAAGVGNASNISPVTEGGAIPWPNPMAMKARGQTASGYAKPFLWLALDNRLFLWDAVEGNPKERSLGQAGVQYHLETPCDVTSVVMVPGTNSLLVGTVRAVHWFKLQPPPPRTTSKRGGGDHNATSVYQQDTPDRTGATPAPALGATGARTGNRHVDFSINDSNISPVVAGSHAGYSPASVPLGGRGVAVDDLSAMFQRKKIRDVGSSSSTNNNQGTATQQTFVDTKGAAVTHLWALENSNSGSGGENEDASQQQTKMVARFKDGSMCTVLAEANDISERYTLKLVHNSIATSAWNFVRSYKYAPTLSVTLDRQNEIVFELHTDGVISARHLSGSSIGASFQCYHHKQEAATATAGIIQCARPAAIAISAQASHITLLLADGSRDLLVRGPAALGASFKLDLVGGRPNASRTQGRGGAFSGNASTPQSTFTLGPGSYYLCDGELTCILDSSTGRMTIAIESRPLYLGNEELCEVIHLSSVSDPVLSVVEVPVAPPAHSPHAFLSDTFSTRRIVVLGERGVLQVFNITSPTGIIREACEAGCVPVLEVLQRQLRPTTLARELCLGVLLNHDLLSRSNVATQLFDQSCYPNPQTQGNGFPVQLSAGAASLWATVNQMMDPLCAPSLRMALSAVLHHPRTTSTPTPADAGGTVVDPTVAALSGAFEDCIGQCEMVLHVLEGALAKRGWRTSAHCKLDLPLEYWSLSSPEEGNDGNQPATATLLWAALPDDHPLKSSTHNDRRNVTEDQHIAAQASFLSHLAEQLTKVRLMVSVLLVAVKSSAGGGGSSNAAASLASALPINLSLWDIGHLKSDLEFNTHLSSIIRGIVVYHKGGAGSTSDAASTIPMLLDLTSYSLPSAAPLSGDNRRSATAANNNCKHQKGSGLPRSIVTELRVYDALRHERFEDALNVATANAAALYYAQSYTHVCNALESAAPHLQKSSVPTLKILACIVRQVQSAGFSNGNGFGSQNNNGRSSTGGDHDDMPIISRQSTASSVASSGSNIGSSVSGRYVPAGYSSSNRKNAGDRRAKKECLDLIIQRLDEVASRWELQRNEALNKKRAKEEALMNEEQQEDDETPTQAPRKTSAEMSSDTDASNLTAVPMPIFTALKTLFSCLDAYDDGSMTQLLDWVAGNSHYISDKVAADWLSVELGDSLHTPAARKVFNHIFHKSERYLNGLASVTAGGAMVNVGPDNRRRYIAARWLLEEVKLHQVAREAATLAARRARNERRKNGSNEQDQDEDGLVRGLLVDGGVGDNNSEADTATPTVQELSTPEQEAHQKELAITLLVGVAKSDVPTSLTLRCLAIETAYKEVVSSVLKEYKNQLQQRAHLQESSSTPDSSLGDFAVRTMSMGAGMTGSSGSANMASNMATAGGTGSSQHHHVGFAAAAIPTSRDDGDDDLTPEMIAALLPPDHPVATARKTLTWQAKMELVVLSAMRNPTVNKAEVDILKQHLERILEDSLDGVTLFTLARQCRQLGGAEVELMILQHESSPEEQSCIEAVRHAVLFHPNLEFSVQDAIVDIVGRFYSRFQGPFPLPFVISLLEGTADIFDPFASIEILHDNAGVPLQAIFACYRYLLEETHATTFHEFNVDEPKMLLALACVTGRMANGAIPSEEWKVSFSFVDSRIKRLLSSSRIGGQQLQPEETALLHKAQAEMLTCEEAIQHDMQAVGTQRSFIFA